MIDRPYSGEHDCASMRRLLIDHLAARRRSTRHSATGDTAWIYPTISDVDWQRCTTESDGPIEGAHLWFDGDLPVGFVWPEDNQAVHLVAHPDRPELEPLLLQWAENWRRRPHRPEDLVELGVWASDGDRPRIELLRASGYKRSELTQVLYHRSLTEPVPPPFLRYGYAILAAAVNSPNQRAAFYNGAVAGARRTADQWRSFLASPAYRTDLDLWVIAPQGEPAAFAIVTLDLANRMALLHPGGCHPDHRHHGLSTALLHECMGRAKALGAEDIQVQVWSEETTTIRLYQGTGFKLAGRNTLWLKTMPGCS